MLRYIWVQHQQPQSALTTAPPDAAPYMVRYKTVYHVQKVCVMDLGETPHNIIANNKRKAEIMNVQKTINNSNVRCVFAFVHAVDSYLRLVPKCVAGRSHKKKTTNEQNRIHT